MSRKRTNNDADGGGRRQEKRARIVKGPAQPEEITSARHLQQLLIFSQDDLDELRNNIRSFKNFLDSILYGEEESLKKERLIILKDYLNSQKPKHDDHVYLRDLEQAWSFAGQVHNDHLFSSITAVLALLFRVISGLLDFRDYGFLLGRMVLDFNQAKLLSRGLSAPTHKEFIISPCLRLLTEVVSFDAGALARQVYAKRDLTFDTKIMGRNLHLNKTKAEDSGDDSKRIQTVRSTSVRYLLAHLKYQEEGPKMDILRNGNIVRALFTHIREDPQHIANEILAIVRNNILLDESIPRQTKSQVMTDRTLSDIASLYRSDENAEADGSSIHKIAHELLLLVCTKPDLGVFLTTSGWYPPGTERESDLDIRSSLGPSEVNRNYPENTQTIFSLTPRDGRQDNAAIDLGLDSIDWYNDFRKEIPVRNVVLASFIQGLRPYSNNLERELLMTIFNAAPELVADYFLKKGSFQFDPKLTATWIGFASVLFSTLQLPVPLMFGRRSTYHSVPPPLSITLESLIPQPLSQRALTKCLNSKSELMTFFTIRILTIAFEKLDRVLGMFRDAAQERGSLWEQATSRLVDGFFDRCPSVRDIITVFQQIPKSNIMRREAMTRLLALCFQVTPSVALDEKLDISSILAETLQSLDNHCLDIETRQMRLLELSHLVTIARTAPDMKWFNKPQILRFSPFITLLKLVIQSPHESSTSAIRELLLSIVREHGVVQTETSTQPLDVLIHTLRRPDGQGVPDTVLDFFDGCIQRFTRKPLKYLDDLDLLEQESKAVTEVSAPLSMLLIPVLEQWAFAPKNRPNEAYEIGRIIDALLKLAKGIGEDARLLSILRRKFDETVDSSGLEGSQLDGSGLKDKFKHQEQRQEAVQDASDGANLKAHTTEDEKTDDRQSLAAHAPPPEPEAHPELSRWQHKDISTIVDSNLISPLLLCLSSAHLSIRREALSSIRKLAALLLSSSHPERELLHLLLLETAETASSATDFDTSPLSYTASVFAARAVPVLAEPTHVLYAKVNRYLNKGPTWDVRRLPSYWLDRILHHAPDDTSSDAVREVEIVWLLDYLYDALRTPPDLEIYRVRSVFEAVLALYTMPGASREVKERAIKVVARATEVQGGATTLVTRVGIVAWLDGRIVVADGDTGILKRVREKVLGMCDRGRVRDWSSGLLVEKVEVE
ncbi:MAG: hypothetical protein Q9165_005783 [Trypethelium subeluteriae]